MTLLATSLFERHVALGAKLADFGGWQMPIEYGGGGVLAEHEAVRQRVGLGDVSHLGTVQLTGPGAAAFVDGCLSNALSRIQPGQAQYTLCCNDSGGVVDDLIVYLRTPDRLTLVPNAANSAAVVARLREAAAERAPGVAIDDQHAGVAVLAVQGPLSDEVLVAAGLPAGHDYLAFVDAAWQGVPVTVCRTGYTGERGYELLLPAGSAPALWDVLLDLTRARGGLPVGLGARDTLRTEMGYPLHGHELSPQISPLQARVGWAVGWDKPQFWGREALLAERAAGAARLAWGLLVTDRGVPRPELTVVAGEGSGRVVGRTTSGTFSPTLRQGIALALLDAGAGIEKGAEVAIEVRGRRLACRVVRPPFVPSHTR
jgi:aminomethyltransferase